ncbi:hypothetical protein [Actinophytocola algeriensis]|uniref:Uncharacterized protein n=1 Tax=Actinophytocola algeriensis TaxID=1768010 RepID=A0A7W7QB69_9PSEU|nr:hypothetical protein [Actinophytocola algeriensis]MBB4909941.1 hypothetical protein [Actinophytocola algeriensis]MBE1475931.1 hypothetical protein [Actinophytocola algeriensis]
MRSCTRRAASAADNWPGAGAPPAEEVGEGDEVDEVAEGDEGDVESDVLDVGVLVEVGVVVAVGDGWSFDVRANAVPAVTASAPATTAPTSSFLVMPVPSVAVSGICNGAAARPMGALPDG